MKAKTINEISFDMGRGDYTKERSKWISENLDEIFKEIREKRISVIAN